MELICKNNIRIDKIFIDNFTNISQHKGTISHETISKQINIRKYKYSSIQQQIGQDIMKHYIRQLLTYIQHKQLTKAQSDEAYSQITRKKTIKSQLVKYIKNVLRKILVYLMPLYKMDITTKMYYLGLAVILIGLFYQIFMNNKTDPRSPKRQSPGTTQGKNKLPKRTSSLLSIKQYESHSSNTSGKQSENQQLKIREVRKITKQYKQYCTDIQTQPHNGHGQSAMETKRDRFFFNVMGSYQGTQKNLSNSGEFGDLMNCMRTQELDYECQYEGESEMSPNINMKPKISQKQPHIQKQRETISKNKYYQY